VALRLISLGLLIAAWSIGSHFAGARLLPEPQAVALAIIEEARSGALAFNLGVTLARVAVSLVLLDGVIHRTEDSARRQSITSTRRLTRV